MTRFTKLLVPALLTCGMFELNAQAVNRGAVISIKPNTVLSFRTDFTNNGTVINNGNLVMAGLWQNNQTYDAGSGGITFNSDLEQIINHNDQSFSRLRISGGGRKIFQANITIENELVFEDGVLVSANGAYIIFTPGSSITGGSNTAHINGRAYHQGSGDVLFPVGDGTRYLPVTISNVPAGAQPGVEVQAFAPGTTLQLRNPVSSIVGNYYWTLDLAQGTLANSSITLPVADLPAGTVTGSVVVAESGALTEPFSSVGQTAFSGSGLNGFVTATGVTQPVITLATANAEAELIVYNGVSPDGDGFNDYWHIENIDRLVDARENKVTIFNRWGDKLWSASNYDNATNVFTGADLPSGTYFYKIEFSSGRKTLTGFLSLKH